jgi:spermidine/putrescine transport system permease protein
MSIEAREARQPWILLSPALTAVMLLLFVPLLFIVVYSFWLRSAVGADTMGFHLDNWQRVLTDPFYRYILLNTLKIAAITTVLCAVLGYPAAYFIARSRGNKLLLLVLLMLPFWISYIIRTMSWINILGTSGALNTALMSLGITSEPIRMLYNEYTVILGWCISCCPSWCSTCSSAWTASTPIWKTPPIRWAPPNGRPSRR